MIEKFPSLESERLRLGQLSAKDIPSITAYADNPNISKMTLNLPYPYFEKDAIFWINMSNQGFQNKNKYIFGVFLQSTAEFIGGIGLHLNEQYDRAEIGYWIAEPFWGKGYCSEAVSLILNFGFNELKIHKIYASHLIGNPASGKVMINNGMIKEGEMIDHFKKGDEYRSVRQYRLTKAEYDAL